MIKNLLLSLSLFTLAAVGQPALAQTEVIPEDGRLEAVCIDRDAVLDLYRQALDHDNSQAFKKYLQAGLCKNFPRLVMDTDIRMGSKAVTDVNPDWEGDDFAIYSFVASDGVTYYLVVYFYGREGG